MTAINSSMNRMMVASNRWVTISTDKNNSTKKTTKSNNKKSNIRKAKMMNSSDDTY